MKFSAKNEFTAFSFKISENKELSRKVIENSLGQFDSDSENERAFTHVVLTTGIYERWGGVLSFSLKDLESMKNNHIKGVIKEDVCLYQGHEGFFGGGGRESFGHYSRDKKKSLVSKVRYVDPAGKETDKYCLVLSGEYTDEGLEKVNKNEFKYISGEVYGNYKDREITVAAMKYFKASSIEDAMEKFEEKIQQVLTEDKSMSYNRVKYELTEAILKLATSYGATVAGVALTNTPFFHLPTLQEMQSSEVVETIQAKESDFKFSFDGSNIYNIGREFYLKLNDNSYTDITQLMNDHSPEGEAVREAIERHGFSVLSAVSYDFSSLVENNKNNSVNSKELLKIDLTNNDVGSAVVDGEAVTTPKEKDTMDIAALIAKFSAMSYQELMAFDKSSLNDQELFVFNSSLNERKLVFAQETAAKQTLDFTNSIKERDAKIARLSEDNARKTISEYALSVEKFCSDLSSRNIPKAVVDNLRKFAMNVSPETRELKLSFSNTAENFSFDGSLLEIFSNVFSNIDKSVFATEAPEPTSVAAVSAPQENSDVKVDYSKVDPSVITKETLAKAKRDAAQRMRASQAAN